MAWFGRCSEQSRILFWWALIRAEKPVSGKGVCAASMVIRPPGRSLCEAGRQLLPRSIWLQSQCEFHSSWQSLTLWQKGTRVPSDMSGGTSMQGWLLYTSFWKAVVLNLLCVTQWNTRQPWEWVICVYTTVWMNPQQGVMPGSRIKVLLGCWLHNCMSTL